MKDKPMGSKIQIGDTVKYFNKDYLVVGLSTMIYDESCTGEPEWKITHEIQEVAIADNYDGISYQKPCWVKVNEVSYE